MRGAAYQLFALACALACAAACGTESYRVVDASMPAGMGRFRSASIEVNVSDDARVRREDVVSFAAELEREIRGAGIFAEVTRAPGSAELAVRVTVAAVGRRKDARVDVELVDTTRRAVVGRFSVAAEPSVQPTMEQYRGRAFESLRTAARAVATELANHR